MHSNVHTILHTQVLFHARFFVLPSQDVLNEQFVNMKRENATLWQELDNQRQRHMKQQQVTYKLLQFIMASVVPNSSASPRNAGGNRATLHLGKRKLPALMQNDLDLVDRAIKRATGAETSTSSTPEPEPGEPLNGPTSGPIISEIFQRDSPEPDAAAVAGASAVGAAAVGALPGLHPALVDASQIQSVFSIANGAPMGSSSPSEGDAIHLANTNSLSTNVLAGNESGVSVGKFVSPGHAIHTRNIASHGLPNTNHVMNAGHVNNGVVVSNGSAHVRGPKDVNGDGLTRALDLSQLSNVQAVMMADGSTVYVMAPSPNTLPSSAVVSAAPAPTIVPPTVNAPRVILEPRSSNEAPTGVPLDIQIISGNSTNGPPGTLLTASTAKPATSPSSRNVATFIRQSPTKNQFIPTADSIASSSPVGAVVFDGKGTPSMTRNQVPAVLRKSKSAGGAKVKKSPADQPLTKLTVAPSDPTVGLATLPPRSSFSDHGASNTAVLPASSALIGAPASSMTARSKSPLTAPASEDPFAIFSPSPGAPGALSTLSPPSFVDVYGLHSRPSGSEMTKDAVGSPTRSVMDTLLSPTTMEVGSLEGKTMGDDLDEETNLHGDPMASSLSLLPSSATYHPKNYALSLNNQIDEVDAGLESIKDALVCLRASLTKLNSCE